MVRLSLVLSASFLVFWISVLGSTSSLLYGWRSTTKALSPRVFELLLWSRIPNLHRPPARKRSTTAAAVPKLAGCWLGGCLNRRSGAASYGHGRRDRSIASAATIWPATASLSRPVFLEPATVAYSTSRTSVNEGLLAEGDDHFVCGHYRLSSKLDSNGSNNRDGENQKQRRLATPVPPPPQSPPPPSLSAHYSPYTGVLGGSSIAHEATVHRHELPTADVSLLHAKEGRELEKSQKPATVNTQIAAALRPMSSLLYRGSAPLPRPAAGAAAVPASSTSCGQGVSLPTATGTDIEDLNDDDDELLLPLARPPLAYSTAATRPVRQSRLLSATHAVAASLASSGVCSPAQTQQRPMASALYRKRALALRRASGRPTKTLVAPEELTASAILPEEPNGITSMIAISTVLIFATFVAF